MKLVKISKLFIAASLVSGLTGCAYFQADMPDATENSHKSAQVHHHAKVVKHEAKIHKAHGKKMHEKKAHAAKGKKKSAPAGSGRAGGYDHDPEITKVELANPKAEQKPVVAP